MGQYYIPVAISDGKKMGDPCRIKAVISTWDLECGSKITEHAYEGNPVVEAMYSYLTDNPSRVVWAGDYAENEDYAGSNLYTLCSSIISVNKGEAEADDRRILGCFGIRMTDCDTVLLKGTEGKRGRYLVNHDKHRYIDIDARQDPTKWVFSALPLLTAEGNGQSFSDYEGTNMRHVGTWARDLIEVSDSVPGEYREMKMSFKAKWM